MKNFIYIAIFSLLATACKPGVPKDLIQPDKMALVLHDIHVFDGYINAITNNDTARVVAAGYYKGIYQKFSIDSALYARSMKYYNAHPPIMTEIYTKVVDRLDKEKKAFVKADSIANAKIEQRQKLKMKADSVKARKDSIKLSDSKKIEKERKKLLKQLDSLRIVQKKDSLKRAAQSKRIKKNKPVK